MELKACLVLSEMGLALRESSRAHFKVCWSTRIRSNKLSFSDWRFDEVCVFIRVRLTWTMFLRCLKLFLTSVEQKEFHPHLYRRYRPAWADQWSCVYGHRHIHILNKLVLAQCQFTFSNLYQSGWFEKHFFTYFLLTSLLYCGSALSEIQVKQFIQGHFGRQEILCICSLLKHTVIQ